MQPRNTPSLAQIAKKKHLSGADAGRALLLCTAESAKTGQPSALPENVAQYINANLPYATAEELTAYRRYANMCSYLSQQRALADAHGMRLFAYLVSQLKSLETTYALEKALSYFSPDGASAAAAYAENAGGFVGYGIEALIPDLYSGSSYIAQAAVQDEKNCEFSTRMVACYNASIQFIEEAAQVRLDVLRIDTTPFDEKMKALNTSAERLRALLQAASTPYRREKIQVLDSFFPPVTLINDVPMSPKAVEKARTALINLAIFDNIDAALTDILMEADPDA